MYVFSVEYMFILTIYQPMLTRGFDFYNVVFTEININSNKYQCAFVITFLKYKNVLE